MHTAPASRTIRILAALAVVTAAGRAAQTDACSLLSPAAIRQATGEQATNTKSTSQIAGKLRQSQCFYSLPTFTNSISVTLTSATGLRSDAAREMWERWFHRTDDKDEDSRKPESEEEEAAAKAAPVAGVGDEAYWVHSFVGNLYVRKGNRFLRISLGGKMTDDQRQARAKALAAAALQRLR
jgi:hypothetical protein